MNSFDEIYALDLHGDASRGETSLQKEKDENVFDIKKGVAITFFIKKVGKECKINYSDVWGLRERKYEWLSNHDIETTKWQEINPHIPYYFFVPREEKHKKLYDKFWKIADIFPLHSVGVVTARDKFVIDFDGESLKSRLETFRNLSIPDDLIRSKYKLRDTDTFKLRKSREKLSQDHNWEKHFTEILYRPFDIRRIYYSKTVVERPLYKLMQHMQHDNLGIHTCRQLSTSKWRHVLATQGITDDCYVSNKTRERGYLFPLYVYGNNNKQLNVNPKIIQLISENYGKKTSKNILYYTYGILYSNIYRKKYNEFLKSDFPKIPFTKDYGLFKKMSELGEKLVDLHLFNSQKFNNPISHFNGEGNNIVEKVKFKEDRVYINNSQYFIGIDNNVWNFFIGGYQILSKWLKDRKGNRLSLKEIKHYCKIVTAIGETIKIQKEIDKLYPQIEKKIIDYVKTEKNSKLTDFEN